RRARARPGVEGGHARAALEAARRACTTALARRLPELPTDATSISELEPPFRIRAVTFSAHEASVYALQAQGSDRFRPAPPTALEVTEQTAIEHTSVRSIWFRNSIRGAAGLALAVLVAQ